MTAGVILAAYSPTGPLLVRVLLHSGEMPRPCSICTHPERHAIEAALHR